MPWGTQEPRPVTRAPLPRPGTQPMHYTHPDVRVPGAPQSGGPGSHWVSRFLSRAWKPLYGRSFGGK